MTAARTLVLTFCALNLSSLDGWMFFPTPPTNKYIPIKPSPAQVLAPAPLSSQQMSTPADRAIPRYKHIFHDRG